MALVRVIAMMLSVFLFPGALEAIADVSHEVFDGHSIDADFADNHHEDAPASEHHCSGAFHVCGCCAAVPMVAVGAFSVGAPRREALPAYKLNVGSWTDTPIPGAGVRDDVFRPPIA